MSHVSRLTLVLLAVLMVSPQLCSAATFTGAPFSAVVQANNDCAFTVNGDFKGTSGAVSFVMSLKKKKTNKNAIIFANTQTFNTAGQQVSYTNTAETEGVFFGSYLLSPPDYVSAASYWAKIECYVNGIHVYTIKAGIAPNTVTWLPFPAAAGGSE